MKSRPVKRLTDKEIIAHTIQSAEIEGIYLKDKDKEKLVEALKKI
jgi:hypothetical protein